MPRTLPFLALLVLLLAADGGSAPAQGAAAAPLPPIAGRVVLAGCRQGECRWMRIVRLESEARAAQGELRRMIVRKGSSIHLDGSLPDDERDARIEWEASDETDYAFCSVRRPAYAFQEEGGGLVVHFLDLFNLGGYQQVSGRLYMRLCHGRGRVPRAAALRRLGYRPGTRSEQIEDSAPEAMIRF